MPVPLLVTVALLAVVVGLGQLTVPENRPQVTGLEPAKAAVSAARVVCPDANGVAVAAPGSGKGKVTVGEVGSFDEPALSSLRRAPGRAVVLPDEGAKGPVMATAEDGLAPGFEAQQYVRKDTGEGRGLAETRCMTPRNEWWFAGPSTTGGTDTRLYLSNADRTAATVDVYAYSAAGPADPSTGRSIATVDPGGQEVLDLAELAPELDVSAIQVVARTGRVAAAIRMQVADGDTDYGTTWVPPARPTQGNLLIPGLPEGAGKRKLVLFAPGDEGTTAHLRISRREDMFAPTGGADRVDIPAQQVVEVDLSSSMTKSVTAVQVNSDVPLIGSIVATEGGSGKDGGVTVATTTPRLTGTATVPFVPKRDVDAALALTATTKDTEVDVRTLAPGPSEPRRVSIGAGKTRTVQLDPPAGESSYGLVVTPRPGGGPVYGARLLTASSDDGELLSALPLRPGVREVSLPPVVPEIGAGVPP